MTTGAEMNTTPQADTLVIGATRCYGDEWFREITVRGMTLLVPLDQQDEARILIGRGLTEAMQRQGEPVGEGLPGTGDHVADVRWLLALIDESDERSAYSLRAQHMMADIERSLPPAAGGASR